MGNKLESGYSLEVGKSWSNMFGVFLLKSKSFLIVLRGRNGACKIAFGNFCGVIILLGIFGGLRKILVFWVVCVCVGGGGGGWGGGESSEYLACRLVSSHSFSGILLILQGILCN